MKLSETKNKMLKIKKFNYGLGFLKVISAFSVIRTHNFNYKSIKNKIINYLLKNRSIHVPSFFIISFYFMHTELLSLNIKSYLNRIERLIFPYILWPLIFFILNNYLFKNILGFNIFSINDLIYQLLIGNSFLGVFWFQWNLIFLTYLFIFIIFIYKKNSLFLIQIIGSFAYFMQYSGYNHKFIKILNPKMQYTLGNICASIPYASTGFTLASLNILNIISNYKIKILFFCIYIFILLDKYSIFSELRYKIGYSGILLNVRAVCYILIFSIFPSDKITNTKIEKIIKYMTKYTAGVYYLHIIIITYFKKIINPIKNGSLLGLFIIYFICYLFCFIGMKLFGNTKLKYLFC